MYGTGLACSPHDERNYAIRRTWRLASCCSSSLRSAAIVSTLFSSPCASAAQTNQLVPTSSNYLRARSHTSSSRPHCSSASAASFMTVFAPLPSDCVDNTRTPTTMQHKPGVRRAPAIHETPRQSHLQRNAQFLDDIFVGDVPRLRSTPGRNVKMAAHPYPYAAHLTLRYREKTATWGAHARPWRSSSPSMISSPTPHVDPSSCPSMRLGVGRQPTIP